jgi:hypothetical protein
VVSKFQPHRFFNFRIEQKFSATAPPWGSLHAMGPPADVAGAAGISVETPEISEIEIALLRLVLAAFIIGS